LRSRPFHLHRTLFEEGSPWGVVCHHIELGDNAFTGTESLGPRRLDLPAETDPSVLLKTGEDVMSVLLTFQSAPLPCHTQQVPPRFLGRMLFFLPSGNSSPVISEGTRRSFNSWLLQSIDSVTFEQESSHHANSPSRACPAGFPSYTPTHRNHRSNRISMNAASEIEQTAPVIQGYPWRLL
jgi:hypothetical protein